MAVAAFPMGSGHSCCLFCMVWETGHCHHPPTHFHHRGERGRAQSWGPTAGCRALAPKGHLWDTSWESLALRLLWQRTARPHTHRSLGWPLSSDRCSPHSSSGNWQLQASSAAGRASRSSWVSAEGLQSVGRPRAHLSHPGDTTNLGATRVVSSAARCAEQAGLRSGPGCRRPQ